MSLCILYMHSVPILSLSIIHVVLHAGVPLTGWRRVTDRLINKSFDMIDTILFRHTTITIATALNTDTAATGRPSIYLAGGAYCVPIMVNASVMLQIRCSPETFT